MVSIGKAGGMEKPEGASRDDRERGERGTKRDKGAPWRGLVGLPRAFSSLFIVTGSPHPRNGS